MKKLFWFLLVLAWPCALGALRADTNLVQNEDFSEGDKHWEGDGKTPKAYAAAHPEAANDPLVSKGLIVPLNAARWTRVYQVLYTGTTTHFSIVVTYKLSPNIALSKIPADYANISKQIHIPGFENYSSIAVQPGQFYGTIGDPTSTTIAMEVYGANLATSDVQTYQHTYPPVPVSNSKTFGLAFPPGTGTIVILNVVVTGQ